MGERVRTPEIKTSRWKPQRFRLDEGNFLLLLLVSSHSGVWFKFSTNCFINYRGEIKILTKRRPLLQKANRVFILVWWPCSEIRTLMGSVVLWLFYVA